MSRRELHAISNENSPFLFSQRSRILEPRRAPTAIHTLGSMSSAAAAADAPEEFAALAEYAVDDFMSEAASDVEVFATTEGHGDVSAEEIRFLARDPHAHDRVISRVARLPRRALRRLLRAAGFDEPVWQTPLAIRVFEKLYIPATRRRGREFPATRRRGREFLEFWSFFSFFVCFPWELVSGRGVFL